MIHLPQFSALRGQNAKASLTIAVPLILLLSLVFAPGCSSDDLNAPGTSSQSTDTLSSSESEVSIDEKEQALTEALAPINADLNSNERYALTSEDIGLLQEEGLIDSQEQAELKKLKSGEKAAAR